MEAKLDQVGEVTVVRLKGKINLEAQQNFRSLCQCRFSEGKVVFCLSDLQFVGSSGIQSFFRTLAEMNAEDPHRVRLAGVKQDFLRVLNYSAPSALGVYESIEGAVQSFFVVPSLPDMVD